MPRFYFYFFGGNAGLNAFSLQNAPPNYVNKQEGLLSGGVDIVYIYLWDINILDSHFR